jgi:RNA polymerase sigma-54 factor
LINKQRLEQKKHQTLSPQQIQFLGLLQIPIVLLEKRIEEELEENPALDEDEDGQLEENQNSIYSPSSKPNFEDFQIEDKSESFEDHLVKQLIDLSLEDNMLFLVKYLINSLDDNGFLRRGLYSISSDLLTNNGQKFSDRLLQDALTILQALEPIGVGAKNLQDCLLLQLQKLHPSEKIAFQIISEYYTPFSNKNFELLIKNLNLSEKELKKIYRLIESLNPLPKTGFSKNIASAKYIYADFTITKNNNQLQLQVNKGNIKTIKVSEYYSNLLLETIDITTKEFLTQKIERAKWFKESMEKREATLIRVMEAIIQLQKEYLISGAENDLKPMKLANVADVVNMDISTISRVSNSKFIETHFGTFKVKELFSDAFRKDNGELISTNEIKNKLKEIILREDKLRPFTDEQLSEILGEKEYHIARRTVAKYRELLGIETAKLRREL